MDGILELIKKQELLTIPENRLEVVRESGRYLQHDEYTVYRQSIHRVDRVLYFIVNTKDRKTFCAVTENENRGNIADFKGKEHTSAGFTLLDVDFTYDNYLMLKDLFAFTGPISLRDKRTTVGCGDRLGLATPGHCMAVAPYDAYPVFTQQSIRELTLTKRNYKQAVADAAFLVFQEGFTRGYGADGDHLKTIEDINSALEAGTPMITLDLTAVLHPEASGFDRDRVDREFNELPEDVRRIVVENYGDKQFPVGTNTLSLSAAEAKLCALMYWDALDFTQQVDRHLRDKRGDAYDFEISIDETTTPTLPEHHLFIIRELQRREVLVNSVAPRFIGEFQKGIDYIGDIKEFEKQFIIHAEIAKTHGNYKISIHSGSDKFSVYPIIGKHTDGRVHLKTAGTSWLEAAKVMAIKNPSLYRIMHKKAFDYFADATKLYHVTTDVSAIKHLDEVPDERLLDYFDDNNARQLIHITYGHLLNDPDIRESFFSTLHREEETHYSLLKEHLGNHVKGLGIGAFPG